MSKEQTGLLKWMLEDIREETLKGICTLTEEQLFIPPYAGEFPLGSYVLHLCEVDIHWFEVISGEKLPDGLKDRCYFDRWFDPSGESAPPQTPIPLEYYASALHDTRKLFLEYVSGLRDEDLEKNVIMKSRRGDLNLTKKWIIYHIIEHEAHHRGQMFMLMRQAGWKNAHQMNDRKAVWWIKD